MRFSAVNQTQKTNNIYKRLSEFDFLYSANDSQISDIGACEVNATWISAVSPNDDSERLSNCSL